MTVTGAGAERFRAPLQALGVCDLCGGTEARVVLRSERLDGPMMRCLACGLHYVASARGQFTFASVSESRSHDLAKRVAELGIARPEVEEAEARWRVQADRERLERVQRYMSTGRLLDVGCATGSFLRTAAGSFAAVGIEPDPGTSEAARAAGLSVQTGSIDEARPGPPGFDAVTMFHVIEHLQSPRKALRHVHSLLRPGGVLVIETPTVDTLWFRLAKRRWRQLLPDHYYFFSRCTLTRLLNECGFTPVDYEKVGRRISLRFAADRLRRATVPFAGAIELVIRKLRLADVTVYVRPGDIMTVAAIARKSPTNDPR